MSDTATIIDPKQSEHILLVDDNPTNLQVLMGTLDGRGLVTYLTICSIWILPLTLSEIQAQQTVASPSTSVSSMALPIEDLKSRRLAIENMTDIDASE